MKSIVIAGLVAGCLSGIGMLRAADLSIVVSGVKSNIGGLRMALHDGAKGFPLTRRPVAVRAVNAQQGDLTITFRGLVAGRYAVSLFHDENGNGKLDANLFGLPIEGYGFSNDAGGRLGPAKFDDAAVAIGSRNTIIHVAMTY